MWRQNPNNRHRHRQRHHHRHRHIHRYHHRHYNACRDGKSNWRTDNHAGYWSRQWYAIDDVGRKHRNNHQLNLDHDWKRHDDWFDYWYRLGHRLNLHHSSGQYCTG